MNVLVVGEFGNDQNRVLKRIKSGGHKVAFASSCSAARQMIEEMQTLFCIVIDAELPLASRIEFLSYLGEFFVKVPVFEVCPTRLPAPADSASRYLAG